jgi:endonuclease/exonuclease/phosphatase (EEP) superfamily protein YafD
MSSQDLTFGIWNVWDKSPEDKVIARLKQIIAHHKVDIFGLNEIVATNNGISATLNMLRNNEYQIHFVPFGPNKNGFYDGSVLASRLPLKNVAVYDLAKGHVNPLFGRHDHTSKLIVSQITVGNTDVTLAVIHQPHLAPGNWGEHLKSWRELSRIIKQPEFRQPTIIGGDTNLPNFMFKRTRIGRHFQQLTGGHKNPTWRHDGKSNSLKANYDRFIYQGGRQIDLGIKEFHVLDRQPSDHAPLIAKFNLQTNL